MLDIKQDAARWLLNIKRASSTSQLDHLKEAAGDTGSMWGELSATNYSLAQMVISEDFSQSVRLLPFPAAPPRCLQPASSGTLNEDCN